jgi:hypothetical protein
MRKHFKSPNATLSIMEKDEIVDFVLTLKNPHLAGGALLYDIDVLEQDEPIPSGPVSLFIDPSEGRPLPGQLQVHAPDGSWQGHDYKYTNAG